MQTKFYAELAGKKATAGRFLEGIGSCATAIAYELDIKPVHDADTPQMAFPYIIENTILTAWTVSCLDAGQVEANMHRTNCGSRLGGKFCSNCGVACATPVPESPKQKTFWNRLGDAIVLTAIQQAATNRASCQNGVNQNGDGSWSYRNDYSGNSVISDGEGIYFTK